MTPKTQSEGALQPPGRVPPVATGTATPPVPPKPPRPVPRNERPRRLGRSLVNASPIPIIVIGFIVVFASPNQGGRLLGVLLFGLGMLDAVVLMLLGRYRENYVRERNYPPYDEPTRAEVLRKHGRPDGNDAAA